MYACQREKWEGSPGGKIIMDKGAKSGNMYTQGEHSAEMGAFSKKRSN